MAMEAGAFRGSPVSAACMCVLAPYKIGHFRIEGLDVVVNKPKVAAYRAPGAPMGAFAIESLVDELARELEVDPIDLRLHNAVEEGDVAPYGPTYQAIGLKATLEAAREHPHYKATLGENQGEGKVGFKAASGWDPATGLGTPNFEKLAKAAMKL